MDNKTFFEASNGWQFRVNPEGHIQYRFRDDDKWEYLGTQLGLGFIEWAQSPIWTEDEEFNLGDYR